MLLSKNTSNENSLSSVLISKFTLNMVKVVTLNLFQGLNNIEIPKHGGQSDVRNDCMYLF